MSGRTWNPFSLEQLVEVVAGHPTRNARVAGAHLFGVVVAKCPQGVKHLGLAAAAPKRRPSRPEAEARAFPGEDVEFLDVVGRAASHHRVNPTGVVADHAPSVHEAWVDGSGPKVRPWSSAAARSASTMTPGSTRAPRFGVDRNDPVQVAGEIDHDSHVAGLAREAGSRSARQDRRIMVPVNCDRRLNVVYRLRHDHTDRNLPIVRRVLRVERPIGGAEPDLAPYPPTKIRCQRASRRRAFPGCRVGSAFRAP